VPSGRWSPAQNLRKAPRRHERPYALEQEEAQLFLVPGENRKDHRADQVEHQVETRALVEVSELGGRERYEDQQGARDLNRLVDRCILRSGQGTTHTSWCGPALPIELQNQPWNEARKNVSRQNLLVRPPS
jgi:hypothetical protein